MKIRLIVFGETNVKPVAEILSTYSNRIQHYFPFETIVLKATNADEEGELLLKKIEPAALLILLDEAGKEYTSVHFAEQLNKWINSGGKQLTFVIGGAYGFSAKIYERANAKLSLSKMTMPHQLVRAVFAEQLYRACTILKNEKYHH
ncbi:MAG: 23S rRNA (pseudouridine(1915)-N(3))-methyltransferase RlmH [Chitinophagales bacterium]|nr:23S rRNA (pseudouridine(1915)-N(3))-methyltransferase RlmH [Chitinophagales bacterium]